MVFCNSIAIYDTDSLGESHNPYFSRWFSAILKLANMQIEEIVTILILVDGFLQFNLTNGIPFIEICHNPYFSRWFSAIGLTRAERKELNNSHNPYFSRWFSAISK